MPMASPARQAAPGLGEDSAAEGEESPGACTWVSRVERRSEELRRLFKLPPTEACPAPAVCGDVKPAPGLTVVP